jgi:hypothetical protein
MNDLDDTTFARFAERFARIERQVPEPPPHKVRATVGRPGLRPLLPVAGLVGVVILLAASVGLAVIGSQQARLPSPSHAAVTIPPDSAPPAAVLDAYLRALQAGDCGLARELTIPRQFGPSMVDLCGVTGVIAYSISDGPVVVDPSMVRFETALTITGTAGGIAAGEFRFTYFLQQQSSRAWRIVDGGGGIPPSMLVWPSPS